MRVTHGGNTETEREALRHRDKVLGKILRVFVSKMEMNLDIQTSPISWMGEL